MKGIVLGGFGRSGTSLLRDWFIANPRAVSFRYAESKFFVEPYGLLDLWRALVTDYTYARGLLALSEFRRLTMHQLLDAGFTGQPSLMEGRSTAALAAYHTAFEHFIASCMEGEVPLCLTEEGFFARVQQLLSDVSSALREHDGAIAFIEKTPHNALNPGFFNRVFDPLYCVWIVRDPRAVAYSTLKQSWGPSTLEGAIAYVRQVVRRYLEVRNQTLHLEVMLEDLVTNPGAVQARIERHCEFAVFPEAHPPEPKIVNDWKTRLVGADLARVTDGLAEELALLGYGPDLG